MLFSITRARARHGTRAHLGVAVSGPVFLTALRPLIHRAIHRILDLQEALAVLGILYFYTVRRHEKRSQSSDRHRTESKDLKS